MCPFPAAWRDQRQFCELLHFPPPPPGYDNRKHPLLTKRGMGQKKLYMYVEVKANGAFFTGIGYMEV